ncbi:MAG: hypothetical protein LBE13_15645 [Bacteroidales bacterium]|jgi:hypothetical protein|nr:hypothetical protein [Bacteroidales bacterium]
MKKMTVLLCVLCLVFVNSCERRESIFINPPKHIILPEELFGISVDNLTGRKIKADFEQANVSYEHLDSGVFSAEKFIGSNIKNDCVDNVIYNFGDMPYDMCTGSIRYGIIIYLSGVISKNDLLHDLNIAFGKNTSNYSGKYTWIIESNKSKIISVILYEPTDSETSTRLVLNWPKPEFHLKITEATLN